MLVAERYERIVQWVNDRGGVRVSELSELCGVTEETIRRDLDKLEREGKLKRSHGGAVRIMDQQPETPFSEREIMNVAEKKNIAAKTVKYIRPNDRIALDASTTSWYVAQSLPDMPLTVLTNSIQVALELSGKKQIEVLSTGGILSSRSLSYVGPLAEANLDPYHVNKAFISSSGVHLAKGISDPNELQARFKRKLIGLADEVFLMADYSKFGVQAFAQIAPLALIDRLITDSRTDAEVLSLLAEQGIEIIQLEE